jgi:hypothetical protein
MKQDHLHPPSVSTTPLRICGTPIRLHRHRRAFTAHPLRLHDITAFLRYSPVHPRDHLLCLTDTTAHLRSTHLSHRHHRAFAVHSVRFHDIAVHLWFTCFVSSTSLHICGSPIRLTDIAAHSRFTPPFVSMTPPCICGPPTLSHRHRRAFVAHPFCHLDITASLRTFAVITGSSLQPPTLSHRHRRAFTAHPLRLYDIAASLRYSISSLRPPPPTLSHRHCRALAVHPLSHRRRAFAVHFIWSLRLHPPSQYFYFLPFGHLSHERECQIIRDRARLP